MADPEGDRIVNAGELVDFTLRLVREPSPSGAEGAVARIVAAEMERLGFAIETDDLGNVVGTIDAGPGPCILFDAHMDTVGVSNPDDWSRHPVG